MYPIIIITTEIDTDVLERVRQQVPQPYTSVRVVTGVLGRLLPDTLCLAITRDPNSLNNKGAVGCFLGHVRAWELVASSGSQAAIILEDDAQIKGLDKLEVTSLPIDFDIIFLNDRMSLDPNHDGIVEFSQASASISLVDERKRSVGGDGYLLSKQGAAKLIKAIEHDLFFSHVDLRILAYCLTEAEAKDVHLTGPIGHDLKHICSVTRRYGLLRGYTTRPALVWHPELPSRREREDHFGKFA